MSAVVVIVGDGADGPGLSSRVEQSCGLWGRLGLPVDLVLVTRDPADPMPPVPFRRFRRVGCLPGDAVAEDRAALDRFLLRLNEGVAYMAAHGVLFGRRPGPSAARLFVAEPAGGVAEDAADLFLARVESHRAAQASNGLRSVRLPVPLGRGRPAVSGKAIGWMGGWSGQRIAAWNEVLLRLSRRGADLSGGIVLAGEGAEGIAVPDNLAQWAGAGSGCGHLSVMGLIAAPGNAMESDGAVIDDALSLRVPVLLSREGADLHEDRWHLPIIDDDDRFFEITSAWAEGDLDLSAALEETVRALSRDLEAMTAHVLAEITALLAPAATFRR